MSVQNPPPEKTTLVLLRHGQSVWNRDKVFTGWSDVALSPKGKQEAKQAAQLMQQSGLVFDACYSSTLQRSTESLKIILSEMGLETIPAQTHWRLNERNYGALEGLPRWSGVWKYGVWPVLKTQLQFAATPPQLTPQDPRSPLNQADYANYAATEKSQFPLGESMQQTHTRLLPYWQQTIKPELQAGKRILIVSHKNLLRTLRMELDQLSPRQVMKLAIKTGRPLVYELDPALNPLRHYYLDSKV